MLQALKTRVIPLFQQTFQDWNKDNCSALGAALAYYALFSLFPLLLVILSIIGFVYSSVAPEVNQWLAGVTDTQVIPDGVSEDQASDEIFALLRNSVSEQAANQIEQTLAQLEKSRRGAGLIGFAMLLVSASGAFGQLDRTFNIIWKVHQQEQPDLGIVGTAMKLLQKKLFSFGLVIGCAVLLFVSMSSGVVIKVLSDYSNEIIGFIREATGDTTILAENSILPGNDMVWGYVHTLVSFLILTFTLMLLFKYLPDVRVRWSDVWIGGLLTAVLFIILLKISSFVISQSNFESYGVLGGIMAFLLWIFLSSQVLFFGAEFSHSYTRMFGSHAVRPAQDEPEATGASAAGDASQAGEQPSDQPVTTPQPATPPAPPPSLATATGISFLTGMAAMLVLSIAGLIHSGGRLMELFKRKHGRE